MKYKVFLILFMAVLLCGFASPALAQEQPLPDVGSYSSDALSGRLSALKEQYRIKLSDKERERVVERCEQAQEGLSKISTAVSNAKSSRLTTYDAVVSSLSGLRALVVAKQVDASNIELLIVEYQQKRTQFDTAISAYQVALEDSVQVDCKTKPEEFRAALEGVRSSRKQVVSISSEITEITKSNLKTVFDTLKNRLNSEDI